LTAIGWVRVATHRGVIMTGQVLDELAGQLPGDTAVPDDDPGPDDSDRHAAGAEQALDLTAAAQVGGQAVRVDAQGERAGSTRR
jgi:hypothetical protein